MNKLIVLKDFYNTNLLSNLQKIETKRKAILLRLFALGLVLGVAFPAAAYFVIKQVNDPNYLFYFIPLFALLAIGFYIVFESLIKNTSYYAAFKHDIISKLINFINPTLHYDKKNFVSPKEFYNSRFFVKSEVGFDGDDHVSGTIENVKIEFSELKSIYKGSDKRKKAGTKYQFRGIFFVAEAPRPFGADLVIEPKKENTDVQDGRLYYPLDAQEFNQYFQVRILGDTKTENAENIVNQDFINRLVNFKSQLHNDIYISFIYNKMYVGIYHDKDLFEPSLFENIVDFDKILQSFHDLYYPISIIERFAAHKQVEAYTQSTVIQ